MVELEDVSSGPDVSTVMNLPKDNNISKVIKNIDQMDFSSLFVKSRKFQLILFLHLGIEVSIPNSAQLEYRII